MSCLSALRGDLIGRDKAAVLSCKSHTPYEGCWWEPNYWLLHEKLIYPIHVSGRAYELCGFSGGVADVLMHSNAIEKFVELLDEEDRYDGWEIEEIDDIEPNPNTLNSMTAILSNHGLLGPIWTCEYCDKRHRGIAHFLGYTGNGGVGVWLTDPCCDSCFDALRWCEGCYSTVLPEDGFCPSASCQDMEEPASLNPLDPNEDDQAVAFHMTGGQFTLDHNGEPYGDPPNCTPLEDSDV